MPVPNLPLEVHGFADSFACLDLAAGQRCVTAALEAGEANVPGLSLDLLVYVPTAVARQVTGCPAPCSMP